MPEIVLEEKNTAPGRFLKLFFLALARGPIQDDHQKPVGEACFLFSKGRKKPGKRLLFRCELDFALAVIEDF